MAQLIHELIVEAAARTPAALALRASGTSLDYAALGARIAAFGAGLRALGAAPHDRVAIWLPNGADAASALFGASWAGCACVPINPDWSPRRAAAVVRESGARVLVTSSARLAVLGPVLDLRAGLRSAVVCGQPAGIVAGIETV